MTQNNCPTCGGSRGTVNQATGSTEPCPNCEQYLDGQPGGAGQVFQYQFYPNPIAPAPLVVGGNATVLASLQIANDATFICDRFIASSTGAFSVFITDNFSSKPMMPSDVVPINGANIAGTAQLPYWLPKRWKILRTTTLTAYFTDNSGESNTIQFILGGFKTGNA